MVEWLNYRVCTLVHRFRRAHDIFHEVLVVFEQLTLLRFDVSLQEWFTLEILSLAVFDNLVLKVTARWTQFALNVLFPAWQGPAIWLLPVEESLTFVLRALVSHRHAATGNLSTIHMHFSGILIAAATCSEHHTEVISARLVRLSYNSLEHVFFTVDQFLHNLRTWVLVLRFVHVHIRDCRRLLNLHQMFGRHVLKSRARVILDLYFLV